MKITRAKSNAFSSGVLCTFMNAGGPAPLQIAPGQAPTSAAEFIRRIRRQRKQRQYVAALPLIPTGSTYSELSLKYAADIAAGRAAQKRMGI